MRRHAVLGLCLLALAGCASNAELAAKRCGDVQGGAYEQCIAREQARLAQQQPTGGARVLPPA